MPQATPVTPEALPTIAPSITNELCLQLRKDGWSLPQIAEKFGVTYQAIQNRLGRIANWVGQISDCGDFKQKRADVLAIIQSQALNHITPQKLEDCSALQLMTLTGIAYDKERLERGLSTENIDTRALTCDIVELDRRIAEKEAALKAGKGL